MFHRKVNESFRNLQEFPKKFLSTMFVTMEELREFRKANHLTQDALGEYLGMKKSFISKIENGREKFPRDKFRKLMNNEMGWDVSLLKGVVDRSEVDAVLLHTTDLLDSHSIGPMRFMSQDPRSIAAYSQKRRIQNEVKLQRVLEENETLKKRIEDMERLLTSFKELNEKYWELIQKLTAK